MGSNEARIVCVIYTGGTVGMLLGEHGFQPEPFYLTSALFNETRFHDRAGDSLLSNSANVQDWRNHRTSHGLHGKLDSANYNEHTLPVRSTRPIVSQDGFSSLKISESCYEASLPSLITPASSTDTKVRYVILEWQPILDSSDMERSDWVRLATEIELNYAAFDAFIVLHGTDTICYTTSALSYLLEDLGKTVIVTGAQIPLSQLRNDAVDNLLGSLSIAGRYIIPEVALYFNHCLYRGNRVSKTSSFALDAFSSPNFPPLVDVGTDIVVNWKNVLRPRSIQKFRAHKGMCADVATLRLFPGITAASARTFLSPPIKGVVIESFGAGNAPQRKDLMNVIKEACDQGIVIVVISQCARGSVNNSYAAGHTLAATGAVAGADMTPEAALTKLSYLLSKPELTTSDVRKLMATPLRGELTMTMPLAGGIAPGVQNIQPLLTQLLRLTSSAPSRSAPIDLADTSPRVLSATASDIAASWPPTDPDTVQTYHAILPFLIHVAAAKNDAEGIQFCIDVSDQLAKMEDGDTPFGSPVLGGICNVLDTSGRSPLHTAALNGSLESVRLLLQNGASVHTRDLLDHTVLYYAMRQDHEEIAQLLTEAGAIASGSDIVNPS